jgi:ParB family transcriptional regulator, chromosome partitioning protein
VAERQKGMGRGLAAILAVAPRDEPDELRQLPIDLIGPNPHQPRRTLDPDGLVTLSESIRARGLIQPVLVRPLAGGRYELIAGERRWRAAQLAGLDTVLALVRMHDDAASLELALIENMAREDLNPVDEARACAALVEELGLTREEVGLRVGRSRVAVSNLIRLLDLPDEALDLLERRVLSEGHGRALLSAPENSERRSLARQAASAGWSVRELEARARGTTRSGPAGPRSARTSEHHPDREAAAEQIADALAGALGADVQVRPNRAGYTAQLTFASVDEALELARRAGAPPVA